VFRRLLRWLRCTIEERLAELGLADELVRASRYVRNPAHCDHKRGYCAYKPGERGEHWDDVE
jgi:hypothetical protein